ncbi:MAG: 4-(cytidine 5'-diphospho)-2-C-methyl-D-erythritol kinase [Eubacteriales bacterium]|nr:4-(cytidine 5'-diphospho)-2-C-methyl-D-erythritol kinase [Eubacteriales bacterium]
MQSLTLEANAKINLSLDVAGTRPDGYHLLTTVMQSVSLSDRVYLELDRQGNGLILLANDPSIPLDEHNTAHKAARLFLDAAGIDAGVRIFLEKSIPTEAGLAGGSTDAAAVLYGLNELCAKPLSQEKLLELAARIGADVPFCLVGGTVLCTGIGEILTPLEAFARVPLILVKPDFGISTPWAFQRYDENPALLHPNHSRLFSAMQRRDLFAMQEATANVLESVSIKVHPILDSLKQQLLDLGAGMALMSGSGPTVFGLFRETAHRDRAHAALEKRLPDGYRIFSVTTRGQGLRIT